MKNLYFTALDIEWLHALSIREDAPPHDRDTVEHSAHWFNKPAADPYQRLLGAYDRLSRESTALRQELKATQNYAIKFRRLTMALLVLLPIAVGITLLELR